MYEKIHISQTSISTDFCPSELFDVPSGNTFRLKHTENEFQYMTASFYSYHIFKIQSIFQFLFKIETLEFLQTFLFSS